MNQTAVDPALFLHVRVLIGIVLGLAVTRLLAGFARLVQHPGRVPTYWVHLGWAAWMLLLLLHFWWWEFRLGGVQWSFGSYAYVVLYAVVLFFVCALLFPEDMSDWRDYREFYLSRRTWIFGMLAASFALDAGDTVLKGAGYWRTLGPEYPVGIAIHVALCAVAMRVRDARFHAGFLVFALAWQVWTIARHYAHA